MGSRDSIKCCEGADRKKKNEIGGVRGVVKWWLKKEHTDK